MNVKTNAKSIKTQYTNVRNAEEYEGLAATLVQLHRTFAHVPGVCNVNNIPEEVIRPLVERSEYPTLYHGAYVSDIEDIVLAIASEPEMRVRSVVYASVHRMDISITAPTCERWDISIWPDAPANY